jgi:hypothetical protein
MKFGVRECANIVFRAKQNVTIGSQTFKVGQPVLYIDTATTSSMEQASTTSYAQGGRGNTRLIAWEGDKTLTFTFTDALLSPIGFHVLSGAGLFKKGDGNQGTETDDMVHFHMTTYASSDNTGLINLADAISEFGAKAKVCADDAPLFVLGIDDDGSLTGEVIEGASVVADGANAGKAVQLDITGTNAGNKNKNFMIDYYIDLPGAEVWEADITPDTFAGYYYVEADTLFRRQSDGKDMPANLTFPNVKIQSNFTITMAGTGDPSSFDFTMDAFPGYTYFDKSKKVLCVLQIAGDVANAEAAAAENPVMPHNNIVEHADPLDNDSVEGNDSGE